MKKRILSTLLALVLCLSLLPTAALAEEGDESGGDVAEVNGASYATFNAAYDAAQSGDTIKLLENVSIESLTVNGEVNSFTLDLNGHQLGGALTVKGAKLTVQDSGNGGKVTSITATNGGSVEVKGGTVGTLTLEKNSYVGLLAKTATAEKLVVNGGHLSVTNGAAIEELTVNQTADLDLYYGIFQKITVTGEDLTIGDLLMDGYGFRIDGGTWYDQTSTQTSIDTATNQNVVAQKLPIQSVSITGATTIEFGNDITLTATPVTAVENATATYQWYQVCGSVTTKLDGKTAATLTVTDPALGVYTYKCEVTVDKYTKSMIADITVMKKTLTDDEVAAAVPTAEAGLTYNTKQHLLVSPSKDIPTGYKTEYKVGEKGTWGEEPRRADAGTYQVYWRLVPLNTVLGASTYEGSTPVEVTIAKATPTGAPKYTAITTGGKTLADAALTTEGGTFNTAGTVKWVDAQGSDLADTTIVAANTAYKWLLTPTDSNNYNTLSGEITLWHKSASSSSNTTSTTVKNPDGSTTTTVTNKKTGEVTETTKTPNGVTGTVKTDKNGNVTDVSANVPASAAKDGTVTLPIDEVKPETGTEIKVTVPSGGATIEIPVDDPTPGTVVVIVNADGTETVIPGSKVTENGIEVTLTEDATIKVIDNGKTFDDVPADAYFADAVAWASARNITGGITAATFGPHQSCTRAQLVTFLWRAAGQPSAKSSSGMSDVPDDAYYAEAVAWAFETGIVGGYGNGLFGSDDTITREQMAVILYRFAQEQGMDTTQGGMAVGEFADFDNISNYAVEAMQWAVNAGIMQGYDGKLMPKAPCTRAQIVTMLYRLLGN